MNEPSRRILSLQSFYGGSHKQFNDGWVSNSRHHWTTIGLPARHWKWRMRHSALYFVDQIKAQVLTQRQSEPSPPDSLPWDAIVCTDMMNVAELRGLLAQVCPAATRVPILMYVHENQLAYPNQIERERDLHFCFTNFISGLAADAIWFNSRFNLESLIAGLNQQAKHWPDFVPRTEIDSLPNKSTVLPPGIEPPGFECELYHDQRLARAVAGEPLRIVWAARWEHDKNPVSLLKALQLLEQREIPFELSVIGESYSRIPPEFDQIKLEFSDRIRRWGFQPDRPSFWYALAEADVFVSTAWHEFFGLAAAEAIAAGVEVRLPRRLAYPELLQLAGGSQAQLYGSSEASNPVDQAAAAAFDAESLADSLERLNQKRLNQESLNQESLEQKRGRSDSPSSLAMAKRLVEAIGWDTHARNLDNELDVIIASKNATR